MATLAAKTATAARKLEYGACTSTSDGYWHEHTGTVEGARRKAVRYAREAFPASDYRGYGAYIKVRDAETHEMLVDYRM